jgi:hypothetical protein
MEGSIAPEIRSEEVQEIISHVPNSLLRWGLSVIFMVLLALLSITWFIKYPDLLSAPVVITTTPAPVNLVSRTAGKITLLKQDNQLCQPGEVVAFIQSNAEMTAVLDLEQKLVHNKLELETTGSLGDLQPYFSAYINSQKARSIFYETKSYEKQIAQLQRQLATYKKLSATLTGQQKLLKQETALALQKFKTDSLLYSQKVIASIDFNAAQTTWLQQQRASENIKTNLFTNELQTNQLEREVATLQIQETAEEQKLTLTETNAYNELLAQINKWKETYLITAPGKGTLSYLGFLENELFIEPGKSLFSIIPEQGKLMARAELPIFGSGKVKVGQQVNIRLENYPFEQFGLLRGSIISISEIPNEQKYFVTIELPQKLITSQNKAIAFKQQLTGTTEIITEDLRLLERFFYQFRKLVQVRAQG